MTAFAAMRLDHDGPVARLTFTEAARGNPIDGRFCADLAEVAVQLARTDGVRCILVTAEGQAFSYGGDIASFAADLDQLQHNILRWTTTFHSAVARLQRLDAPIVAAVHGTCAGGMAGFIAGCDVVVASPGATFVAAYPGIGFSCDAGSSYMFAQRMGIARAKRFLLLNESLSAEAALRAGLADEIVEDSVLQERSEAIVQRLAAGPTRAFGEIKRLFLTVSSQPLDAQLELEAQALARTAGSQDAHEGIAAFAARRAPLFIGK